MSALGNERDAKWTEWEKQATDNRKKTSLQSLLDCLEPYSGILNQGPFRPPGGIQLCLGQFCWSQQAAGVAVLEDAAKPPRCTGQAPRDENPGLGARLLESPLAAPAPPGRKRRRPWPTECAFAETNPGAPGRCPWSLPQTPCPPWSRVPPRVPLPQFPLQAPER